MRESGKIDHGPDARQAPSAPAGWTVDVTLIDEMLRMPPIERLRQNDRVAALAVGLQEAFATRTVGWPSRGI